MRSANSIPFPDSRFEAFKAFASNLQSLLDLFRVFDAALDTVNAGELPRLRKQFEESSRRAEQVLQSPEPSRELYFQEMREAAIAVGEHLTLHNTSNMQMSWYVVMIVTATEAYLQDVLVEAAAVDSSLVDDSEQKLTYRAIRKFDSLDALKASARNKWAKSFLNHGGPTAWIKRLRGMRANGYSDGLDGRLEEIWGIRHLVVHRAAVADRDFLERHADVPRNAGNIIQIDGERVSLYALHAIEFVGITNRYFENRCKAKDL